MTNQAGILKEINESGPLQHIHPPANPISFLVREQPDDPIMFFCPETVQRTVRRFVDGFDGRVTYAVKANPRPEVLENMVTAGLWAFDVASPAEMATVRAICPDAILHYNNPVRSRAEVATGRRYGCVSWSVDSFEELEKLQGLSGVEVSVRLALPVLGAAYDFGSKFGAPPELATALLQRVQQMGLTPAMTFHPGTQCSDPAAWGTYISECASVARAAGVRLARLNVGGGFAAHRDGPPPNLKAIFARIRQATTQAFGTNNPELVCEPGRAMVAESYTLGTRIKAIRAGGDVFLNDGLYGALAEWRDITPGDRITVYSQDGVKKTRTGANRIVFGPTCDSIDRLPEPVQMPTDLAEGDFVLFAGMGAYSLALSTRFNGYGPKDPVTVRTINC